MNDWIRHAIWWQVYPLGFTGAEHALPEARPRPPAASARGLAAAPARARLQRPGPGPGLRVETHGYDTVDHFAVDPRLGTETTCSASRRLLRPRDPRAARRRLQPCRPRLPALPRRPRAGPGLAVGAVVPRESRPAAPDGFRLPRLRGPRRPGRVEPRRPRGRRPRHPGHDPLVRPRGRRLAAGRRLRRPTGVLAAGAAAVRGGTRTSGWSARSSTATTPATSPSPARLGHPVRALEGHLELAQRRQSLRAGPRPAPARRDGPRFLPQTFVGNHDVTRLASRLTDPRHLPRPLALLFTLPGVPTVYYGDESASPASRRTARAGTTPSAAFPPTPEDGRRRGRRPRLHQELDRPPPAPRVARGRPAQEPDTLTNEVLAFRLTAGDQALGDRPQRRRRAGPVELPGPAVRTWSPGTAIVPGPRRPGGAGPFLIVGSMRDPGPGLLTQGSQPLAGPPFDAADSAPPWAAGREGAPMGIEPILDAGPRGNTSGLHPGAPGTGGGLPARSRREPPPDAPGPPVADHRRGRPQGRVARGPAPGRTGPARSSGTPSSPDPALAGRLSVRPRYAGLRRFGAAGRARRRTSVRPATSSRSSKVARAAASTGAASRRARERSASGPAPVEPAPGRARRRRPRARRSASSRSRSTASPSAGVSGRAAAQRRPEPWQLGHDRRVTRPGADATTSSASRAAARSSGSPDSSSQSTAVLHRNGNHSTVPPNSFRAVTVDSASRRELSRRPPAERALTSRMRATS